MRNLLTIMSVVTMSLTAMAGEINSWSCKKQVGNILNRETTVRLQKSSVGYSLSLTTSSNDIGPDWQIVDQVVVDGFDCKFSASLKGPLYCSSEEKGRWWVTLSAKDSLINFVDEETGADKSSATTDINIIFRGESDVLKNYKQAVVEFSAKSCSRD